LIGGAEKTHWTFPVARRLYQLADTDVAGKTGLLQIVKQPIPAVRTCWTEYV